MNYNIPNVWTSYSSLKGSATPSGPLYLINIAEEIDSVIEVVVSDIEPTLLTHGRPIPSDGEEYTVPNEGTEVWLRYARYSSYNPAPLYTAPLTISEELSAGVSNFSLESLMTSSIPDVKRLAVDGRPTSFDNNSQFRFFDRIVDIPNNQQIVYKFTNSNPINVLAWGKALYSGGREILVYPDTGNLNFSGTLSTTGRTSPVNNNLNSSLTSHPSSGFLAERAEGVSIFSTTDLPISGVIVTSSSQGNTTIAAGTEDANTFGVPAGSTIYFVLESIGNNDDSSGHLSFLYEELF